MKKESDFQRDTIDEIREMFPGCIILKNDSGYLQGVPDILVLYKDRWAALEIKRTKSSSKRPNQDRYVDQMNKMSFSRIIFPENKEEVMYELQQALRAGR